MKTFTILFAGLLILTAPPACGQVSEVATELGYRADVQIISSGDQDDCGPRLEHNHDGSMENGYCWGFGGIVPPYYGAFAEAFDLGPTTLRCGAYWFTQIGYYTGQPTDFYVWEGGITDPPGGVLAVVPGVTGLDIPFWPECGRSDIEFDLEVDGEFTVGSWADFSQEVCGYYVCADENGPEGHPWVNFAPGIGYPTGWHHVSMLFPDCVSMGIGAWVANAHEVRPDGTGDYPTIQAAIDAAADDDTIELTDGVFTGDGNRDLDFGGKRVRVVSQSGDPGACIIDCGGSPDEPHRGFHFHTGETATCLVRGVTITGGYAAGADSRADGGGILCENASPRIWDCVLLANTAVRNGGGVSCQGPAAPSVRGCSFVGNAAVYYGAGLAVRTADPIIESCTFVANSGPGGTLTCAESGSLVLNHSIVAFNHAGAAVHCAGLQSEATLTCCDVYGNPGGDWVGCIAEQYGVEGNISEDPIFCDLPGGDLQIRVDSPCAPFTPPNPECDLIGACGVGCEPSGIEEQAQPRTVLQLGASTPSPLTVRTRIAYAIPGDGELEHVRLSVHDLTGRRVRTLVGDRQDGGVHSAVWDGFDQRGDAVPAGVYFFRLQVGTDAISQRIVLVR